MRLSTGVCLCTVTVVFLSVFAAYADFAFQCVHASICVTSLSVHPRLFPDRLSGIGATPSPQTHTRLNTPPFYLEAQRKNERRLQPRMATLTKLAKVRKRTTIRSSPQRRTAHTHRHTHPNRQKRGVDAGESGREER